MIGGSWRQTLVRRFGAAALALFGATWFGTGLLQASPVYNGGPVLSATPNVYFIWYGNWGSDTAQTLLPSFVSGLSGTSYLGTDKTMGGNGLVNFAGSTSISSTRNSSLYLTRLNNPFSQIQSIVVSALSMNLLPVDPRGIYDVLTAPGVSVKGFNTQFCGYHDSTNWGGISTATQFGFVGDPTAAQTGCYVQGPAGSPTTSPNGNFGADAMASVIAHELIETVTDPTGTAWWDSQSRSSTYGNENADMCAWNFGSVFRTSNGSVANYSAGGRNYLLQQEWVNTGGGLGMTGGYCSMASTGAPPLPPHRKFGFDVARAVPEPRTIALFGAGLVGAALLRRRKRQPA
jgi:hypothetical protein